MIWLWSGNCRSGNRNAAWSIREQGRVKDVLERPQDVHTKALLHCRPQLSKRPMRLPMISDFMQQKGDDYIETHTIDVESLQQRSRGLTGQRRDYFRCARP